MFWMDKSKVQADEIPAPEGLPPDVIISPDTRRAGRIPPGQSRTKKWPVLDASGPPAIDLERWRLRVSGLVGRATEWNWEGFLKLPRVKVFADFHCVTRWSRLGNVWEGVSTRELLRQAGGALPEAAYAMAYGYDRGWTTNLPFADFLAEDALVAFHHDWRADHDRTWRSGAFDRAAPLCMEKRQVAGGHRSHGSRPCRFLGEERLPHARRSLARRALRLVSEVGFKQRRSTSCTSCRSGTGSNRWG